MYDRCRYLVRVPAYGMCPEGFCFIFCLLVCLLVSGIELCIGPYVYKEYGTFPSRLYPRAPRAPASPLPPPHILRPRSPRSSSLLASVPFPIPPTLLLRIHSHPIPQSTIISLYRISPPNFHRPHHLVPFCTRSMSCLRPQPPHSK